MNNDVYTAELLGILKFIPDNRKDIFIDRFAGQSRNPMVAFGCSVFAGTWGIDRFVLGQPLLGILKLITCGGFGIWTIVDWFLVGGVAREQNLDLAREIAGAIR